MYFRLEGGGGGGRGERERGKGSFRNLGGTHGF